MDLLRSDGAEEEDTYGVKREENAQKLPEFVGIKIKRTYDEVRSELDRIFKDPDIASMLKQTTDLFLETEDPLLKEIIQRAFKDRFGLTLIDNAEDNQKRALRQEHILSN